MLFSKEHVRSGESTMGKTKKDVLTNDLLRKSHAHPLAKPSPKVCSSCGGYGKERIQIDKLLHRYEECPDCGGAGVVVEVEYDT